jgi:drug/metabolite transporter (DMT)-like permease
MTTDNPPASSKSRIASIDIMLIGMSVVWGINFTMVKIALEANLSPLSFNSIRFSLATVFLLAVLWIRERNFHIRRQDIGRLLLLGLIGNTFYQLLFIHGISRTTAGNSSLILATTPVFVTVLSAVLHTERIKRRIWYGVIISFVGIIFISLGARDTLALPTQSWIGDLLILTGTICWAIYTVLSKPLLQQYSPLKLTSITVAMGTPILVLVSVPSLKEQNWNAVSIQGWFGLAYSFCLAVAIGYTVWYTGVNKIGGARTALYENLITVVALVFAWLLLSENVTPLQVLGMTFVFLSLYLSQKK